jgi:hypothetical protein
MKQKKPSLEFNSQQLCINLKLPDLGENSGDLKHRLNSFRTSTTLLLPRPTPPNSLLGNVGAEHRILHSTFGMRSPEHMTNAAQFPPLRGHAGFDIFIYIYSDD